MRRVRIKADGAGCYHGMSRIIERRHILGEAEKAEFLTLMRNLAAFGGLEILAYALLNNFSSYGAAMGGAREARQGLRRLHHMAMGTGRVSWGRPQRQYRQHCPYSTPTRAHPAFNPPRRVVPTAHPRGVNCAAR